MREDKFKCLNKFFFILIFCYSDSQRNKKLHHILHFLNKENKEKKIHQLTVKIYLKNFSDDFRSIYTEILSHSDFYTITCQSQKVVYLTSKP